MKEYWLCIVGPVEKSDIPDGGDLPMRIAVNDALEKLLPSVGNVILSSGWGVTEEQRERVRVALYAQQSVHWTLATAWQKLVALFRRQSQ
jgi:hypothetical protein